MLDISLLARLFLPPFFGGVALLGPENFLFGFLAQLRAENSRWWWLMPRTSRTCLREKRVDWLARVLHLPTVRQGPTRAGGRRSRRPDPEGFGQNESPAEIGAVRGAQRRR
jgi:hypothetical protein